MDGLPIITPWAAAIEMMAVLPELVPGVSQSILKSSQKQFLKPVCVTFQHSPQKTGVVFVLFYHISPDIEKEKMEDFS